MTYGRFAYLYDELMKDVPYDQWATKVYQTIEKYRKNTNTILDVGCGTGELSIRLTEAGFKVTGIDLSESMLTVAHTKTLEKGLSIPYFQQNMVEMEGLGSFDLITIFCDSLNYLETEKEIISTFQGVYDQLLPGGVFMFDVHSTYKISEIFQEGTFVLNEDKISYIWLAFVGDCLYSVEHELSFFVLDESTGQYERIDEHHFQRTFPISQYEDWLNDTGFDLIEVTADFHEGKPDEKSERIFFTARKPITK